MDEPAAVAVSELEVGTLREVKREWRISNRSEGFKEGLEPDEV